MTLDKLKNGKKGIIIKVKGRGAFRKRILEMGFIKGEEIIVIKNAPLKDPIEYKIMDYNVSLRRNEAKMIEVVSQEEIINGVKKKISKNRQNKKLTLKNTNTQNLEKIKKKAEKKGKKINVALVGNPNSGKTTLFNFASGSKEHVGNYSGVTIKAKEAKFKQDGYTFNIVDLPGTYSVTAYTPEELFVRDFIIDKTPDVIINVIDSSNLERNLYLTTQLIDLDVKVVAALNMYDELKKKRGSV